MLTVPVISMKYMFQNSNQYKVFQFSIVYKTGLVYSSLLSEMGLSQFDTISAVVVYRVNQIPGIVLLNFYSHQC